MKIVADENIPLVKDAFSGLGDARLVRGRDLNAEVVRDAELLLVRSVTKVNARLLDGSKVRFVATATIGTDHVDLPYLRQRGIAFASAPGSNANSVGEYVVAALLALAKRGGFRLGGKTLGVVGVGNVGRKVVQKAQALGMTVLQNDPPLQRQTGDPRFVPLDALFNADAITVHVPLARTGPDATYHLVNADFLKRMKSGSVFLNSSRGEVVDEPSLSQALVSGHLSAAVLDVWKGEPSIDVSLLATVALGTPHIAGYSFNGKINGTVMIYRAACEFLGVKPTWDPTPLLPPPPHPTITVDARGRDEEDVLREVVRTVYDIERDDRALRGVLQTAAADRGKFFDALRHKYRVRREFQNSAVVAQSASQGLRSKLAGIGFRVSE
ncbi:MAG: 4-phosphoerythronate dehydrogenase PdxB [Planctomycetes bacterium]|nr:4-phosphoerythronate dehydrogenase PdxB [Planctomycetota bacterium]MBM4078887.1 4-phosphoerythronate dehydrogenase PdxB [Planctomycetota bacterium]MBM4084619.1 4-phosphoerythronate dehydrogenase PdxB [Planctomycetota bacterium]